MAFEQQHGREEYGTRLNKLLRPAVVTLGALGLFGATHETAKAQVLQGSLVNTETMAKQVAGRVSFVESPDVLEEGNELQAPAKMLGQSLAAENPMHAEDKRHQGSGVVTDELRGKAVKLGFSASGFSEVATRINALLTSTSTGGLHSQDVVVSTGDEDLSSEKSYKAPVKGDKGRWSVSGTFEVTSKYFGNIVGKTFKNEPAPRLFTLLSRKLSKGWELGLSFWQSFGRGSNQETDVGVSINKDGWYASLTRFFIRGGDILQTKVGGSVTVKGVRVNPSVSYYSGVSAGSPEGGLVARVDIPAPEVSVKGFKLRQNLGVGADNNPFGLGKGVTGMAFYDVELAKRVGKNGKQAEWYMNTGATIPLFGTANTKRKAEFAGVRAGYRW